MKKGLTELVFILDRSGSMQNLVSDTIGGFNALLEKQKHTQGQAIVSTVLFNHVSAVLHDRVDANSVPPMTREHYCPGGTTALLDAVGDAIHHIGNVHKYARQSDVPEHTVFVITTDGMENASRRYTADKVKKMIERQKSKYGWEFLFLAANIDAAENAEKIGIAQERAVRFHSDPEGVNVSYDAVGDALCNVRSGASIPDGWKRRIESDYQKRKQTPH